MRGGLLSWQAIDATGLYPRGIKLSLGANCYVGSCRKSIQVFVYYI